MNGYVNSARLVLKHIGLAGDKLEELIAGFNPDAAVAVGREDRQRLLKVVAEKLAEQKQKLGVEDKKLTLARSSLQQNKRAAQIITERKVSGTTEGIPSNESIQSLIAAIKKSTAECELLEQKIAGIKSAISFLEDLVNQRAEHLRSFDAEADAARHRLDMANLRKEQADLSAEMQGIASQGVGTAGLGSLSRAADKAERRAIAAETVTNATANPLVKDDVMAGILQEAKDGPKKDTFDELAALSK